MYYTIIFFFISSHFIPIFYRIQPLDFGVMSKKIGNYRNPEDEFKIFNFESNFNFIISQYQREDERILPKIRVSS